MSSGYCDKDHTGEISPRVLERIPKSQASAWRHKCAACAYLQGRADAATSEEKLRARVRELESKLAPGGGR